MIGDVLYTLTPRDDQVARWQHAHFKAIPAAVAAASPLQVRLRPPRGYLWLLTNVFFEAAGGGAQTVLGCNISILDDANVATSVEDLAIFPLGGSAAGAFGTVIGRGLWQAAGGSTIIDSRYHQLQIAAGFSGIAAANTLNVSAGGYFIPVGECVSGKPDIIFQN